MTWALAVICGVASVPAGLRWLRIAQREHYLAPSVTRFAWRWWTRGPANAALLVVGLIGVVGALWSVWFGFLVAVAQIGPVGLSVRGVSSPLAWTNRLRRLGLVAGLLLAVAYLLGGLLDFPFLVVVALFALPFAIDLALLLLHPVEKSLGRKWVNRAARKLDAVRAEVVAITGSYGKTTAKNYVAHLLAGSRRTVASPASFNNRMGLARAINENLTPGTEVFIAEMGSYGRGEIAELCRWIPPKVAAIVAIGPVHLERFRSEENIVAAKAEILDKAEIGVISVDHPLLADLARERSGSLEIIEVSTGDLGRVRVADGSIEVDGHILAPMPKAAFGDNLAVAIGVCLALGIDVNSLAGRLGDLPVAKHRQSVMVSDGGFSIIDDTFNSNPVGARSGLRLLEEAGKGGRTAVVTPGMVELGPVQERENKAFAAEAADTADHLVIVGHTNRKALLEGSVNRRASVTVAGSREEAVSWVRGNLRSGDAVLYENDLPDHYP